MNSEIVNIALDAYVKGNIKLYNKIKMRLMIHHQSHLIDYIHQQVDVIRKNEDKRKEVKYEKI